MYYFRINNPKGYIVIIIVMIIIITIIIMVIMLVEGRRGTKKESLPLGSRVMSVWMYEYGNLGYHHCDRQNMYYWSTGGL